jgi:HK97 family phage major capsid protein
MVDEPSRADAYRHGGALAYRLGEGDKFSQSGLKFKQLSPPLGKLGILVPVTDELLQDAAALGPVLSSLAQAELRFAVENEILNGTGSSGQMGGILGSAALVTVSKEGSQGATVEYANVLKMWARMWARGRANAVWLVGPGVETQLFQMSLTVGDGGAPVFLPSGGASATPYASLFGRPVIFCEQLPALGDKGDILLADLSQFLVVDKGGPQGQSSIHVRFEYGETLFRFVWRVGGMATWAAPMSPYSGSDSLSAYVCLEARS